MTNLNPSETKQVIKVSNIYNIVPMFSYSCELECHLLNSNTNYYVVKLPLPEQ